MFCEFEFLMANDFLELSDDILKKFNLPVCDEPDRFDDWDSKPVPLGIRRYCEVY